MRNLRKVGAAVAVVGLGAVSAFAEGEPGASLISEVQTALTGTITLLVAAAAVIGVAGLGVWAAPFVIRKIKRFAGSAS